MSAHFPDYETIRTALSLAIRAPSVHNSQPWRWRVGPHSLHLDADPDLQLHSTDPDGRELMLSCGATLNHCVVAFEALGWQAKVRRFPNPAEPDHLAAIELHRGLAGEVGVALAAAIPRRRTDRRLFSGWPVAHGEIALMGARAARAGIALRRVESVSAVNGIVAQAVQKHATDYGYLAELATWTGRYASLAGVPARSTPAPDPTSALPGRVFAGTALVQPPQVSATEDNGVLIALGTKDDERLARLRAGEAASLVLLTATALGLASCPVTEPLEIAETRNMLREELFGTSGYPQMLIRIGWAPINADPLPATPRRPLSEVAAFLDGRPFH